MALDTPRLAENIDTTLRLPRAAVELRIVPNLAE